MGCDQCVILVGCVQVRIVFVFFVSQRASVRIKIAGHPHLSNQVRKEEPKLARYHARRAHEHRRQTSHERNAAIAQARAYVQLVDKVSLINDCI